MTKPLGIARRLAIARGEGIRSLAHQKGLDAPGN